MPDDPPTVRLATCAMGTRFELVLHHGQPPRLRAAGEEAIELIHEQHRRLSAFERGSLLTRVNELAAMRPVAVDREMMDLLVLGRELWRASDGAFDPTVGPLMRAWGFRGSARDESEIARAREAAGFSHVVLDEPGGTVAYSRAGVRLDLGSIAKGFALDVAAQRLRELGVTSALLHGGTSSVVAIGRDGAGRPWRVALGGAGPVVALEDAALGVSAPHGRVVEHEGVALGHVLDPRSGRPVAAARAGAAVGSSAAAADAWSTGLLVLGEARRGPGLESAVRDQSGGWTYSAGWPGPTMRHQECEPGGH